MFLCSLFSAGAGKKEEGFSIPPEKKRSVGRKEKLWLKGE
jgi:hypothetical protein